LSPQGPPGESKRAAKQIKGRILFWKGVIVN
jgi:hypothetical protein